MFYLVTYILRKSQSLCWNTSTLPQWEANAQTSEKMGSSGPRFSKITVNTAFARVHELMHALREYNKADGEETALPSTVMDCSLTIICTDFCLDNYSCRSVSDIFSREFICFSTSKARNVGGYPRKQIASQSVLAWLPRYLKDNGALGYCVAVPAWWHSLLAMIVRSTGGICPLQPR